MKKLIVIIITCMLISQSAFAFENREKSPEAIEKTILRLLTIPAYEAITDYYGQPRQYMNDKLLSVCQGPNKSTFEVVMQVETFYGPHNPPYGIETMTFYVSYGKAELIKFEHRDN